MKNSKKIILNLLMIFIFIFPLFVKASNNIENEIDNIIVKLDEAEKSIFLNSHPVGSIYMTTNADESTIDKMASKYGGTWEVYARGRNLTGYSSDNSSFNTVEKTGGSYNVTLSTSNLPSHSHTISHTHTTPATTISSSGAHTHTTPQTTISNLTYTSSSAGSHTHGFNTGGKALAQHVRGNTLLEGYKYAANSGYWNRWNKNGNNVASAGSHTHSLSGNIGAPSLSVGSSGSHSHTVPAVTTNSISTSTSGATGSNAAFSTLDSYIVTYIYKRVK